MESGMSTIQASGVPVLGAGTLEGPNNELIEAPEEEEEFDVLNDETFGNCDLDWDEEEHNRLAELAGESIFDFPKDDFPAKDHTKDSGYGNAEGTFRSQEEFLEQSISRLMEDEEEEKAQSFFGRGRPIPQGHQKREAHLDQLFGPSSPPALLDAEHLVSPNSKNIWGSPAKESVFQKPTDALRKFLRHAPGGDSTVSMPVPLPSALMQALTLEEIERQMHSRGRKPQVMTAEELERRLRGEESPRERTPQVVNHHPQIGPPHHLPPGLLPASILYSSDSRSPFPQPTRPPQLVHPLQPPMTPSMVGKPMIGMSPINQMPAANGRSSPIPIMGLHQHLLHAGSPQMATGNLAASGGRSTSTPTPPLIRGIPPHHMQSPLPARLMSPYSMSSATALGPSPVPAGFGSRMMTPPPGLPHPIPHGHVPHMPLLPPSPMGTPPNTRLPPPHSLQDMSPQNRSVQQHMADWRNDHQHQQVYRSGAGSDKHRAYRTNYQRPPPWQKNQPQMLHHQHPRAGEETEDEYAGLMTKKEKDWIIKIQLMQLNTDNPYLDDYYYTYFVLKKKQKETGNINDMARFLIPNLAKIESRAYVPTQFEGSLGRLTTSSVHNPRHIIDVTRGSSPTDENESKKNVSKELRKFRQLLMDIEKGYILLLDIEDIEKKVLAVPEDNRMPMFMERHEKICQLYQYFTSDESIEQYIQILNVRKGRKLLARVLPLFNNNQAHVALCILFHHMQVLIKKDMLDDGLSCLTDSVCLALEGSNLESLVRLVNVLRGDKPLLAFLPVLFRNQFSAVVLCGLMHQAEKVFKETSPVDLDNQLQTEWTQFVDALAESLQKIEAKDLPAPVIPLPLAEPHLSRLLNAQVVGDVEEKVRQLTTVPQKSSVSAAPGADVLAKS